ncbi:MAG: ribosome maturation factor RimP [Lachnospiraceae bacterium]|jgi:ribosome maturation factor RimP|nr:ribosome maturation factor RimP [Lachnospiraceae bacterium]
MSKKEDYVTRTEALVTPFIQENNFELVDTEFVKEGGNYYLRVYIDKPGGINIDDCELISRALSDKLDEEDYIEEAYILEVSSPGLGRPLKKEKDYQRALGEEIEIKLYKAMDKVKEFQGILKSYDDETVTIEENGNDITFEKKNIAIIRLAIDF